MLRAFLVLFFGGLLLTACTQRMICPAYQSAFIYDKEELRKRFSYFQEDSTPKIFTASKNKYLVAEATSYRKKIRTMQTVPMKPVNVNVPDSLKPGYIEGEDGIVPGAELDLAARSVIDSIYIEDVDQDTLASAEDSVYVITKDKEIRILKYDTPDSLRYDPNTGRYVPKTPRYYVTQVTFNVEQDNYMWYLRDYLVLPDVRLAKMGQATQKEEAKTAAKKQKKGVGGFFKNLFKKKKKEDVPDSTNIQQQAPPSEEDFEYVDESEKQQASAEEQEPQKKGAFSFLKKKKKDKPAEQPADDTSAPPEEKPKKKKEKKPKQEEEETPPEDTPEDDKKPEDSF